MSQSPLYPQGPGHRAKPELASPRQTNDPGQGVRADPATNSRNFAYIHNTN